MGKGANVPEVMEKGGREYRLFVDQLGSVRQVVDVGSGQVVQELEYDAWGLVVRDTNPGFQPFGFAGGLYDPQTKLVRFGARDYDPTLGRWTAKDPVVHTSEPQLNLYSYAGLMPTFMVDPDGEMINRADLIPPWLQVPCAALLWRKPAAESGEIVKRAGGQLDHNDKFRHCYVSCVLVAGCGYIGSVTAGLYKELKDWERKGFFDWPDMQADLDGIQCAYRWWDKACGDCECCCKQKYPIKAGGGNGR